MKAEIRRQAMLAAVAFVMAFGIYRSWPDDTSVPAPPPNGRGRAPSSAAGTPGGVTAPEVHLRALADERPKPASGERNLFRYRARAPVITPAQARAAALAAAPPPPSGPPPPPPLAPIGYKFIGIVEARAQAAIAVLSDGKNVFHGREGDIIEGRYRILRVGAESIEMAYLDGRGRQTIRLTGS